MIFMKIVGFGQLKSLPLLRFRIKAEKAAERARQRAERQQRYGVRVSRTAAPTPEPKQKASSEEQLKILKMVEQGIISPNEAATLLEALEK